MLCGAAQVSALSRYNIGGQGQNGGVWETSTLEPPHPTWSFTNA